MRKRLVLHAAALSFPLLVACATPVPGGEAGTALEVPVGSQQVWCAGQGPAVVLINGIGDNASSAQWLEVQARLSPHTRVCRYDRPGTGDSPPPSVPGRDAADLDTELEAVIDHVAGDDQVILVAHSFAGYLARVYADRHPERIRGLVFVDALDPSVGLLGGTGSGDWEEVSMADEDLDLRAVEAAVAAIARLPGSPPVIVLVRGRGVTAAWTAGQERLAALSECSKVEVVEGAGHQIPAEAPQAIADAVMKLLPSAGAMTFC